MKHEEILGKAEAYRAGKLNRHESADMGEHLASCAACREIIARWPTTSPRSGFTLRVMAHLEEAPSVPDMRPLWAPLAGVLLSMLLVLVAFWHPERDWVRADKSFASFDRGVAQERQVRHE